jgi:LIVCS family branched-chain amino acid:cation transporter
MHNKKEIWIIGFALFSMFFGAGNSILPPYLGFNSGSAWFFVALGFITTAAIIPILGILAHAKLQGTMYDFGKKISPLFSTIYCLCVYIIAITLPGPRTASVTHEMAVMPLADINSIVTSTIYFSLVFVCVLNRSKILDFLGKYLAPIIGLVLLAIIGIGLFTAPDTFAESNYGNPVTAGLLEGYQTFDALGAILAGGILIISLDMKKTYSYKLKRALILKAGVIAGIGLFIIYAGMIWVGGKYSTVFPGDITRSGLLTALSFETLGNIGQIGLSIMIGLACFTTAVSIVIGTADYSTSLFKNSRNAYLITAAIACIIGILVGQFEVKYIIHVALPALMFIYPITVVLILLNVLPDKWATEKVFKTVIAVTFLFSIPYFLKFFVSSDWLNTLQNTIPLGSESLGWVLPALLAFIAVNLFKKN